MHRAGRHCESNAGSAGGYGGRRRHLSGGCVGAGQRDHAPLGGAAPFSVRVAVEGVPPVTVLGFKVSDVRPATVTRKCGSSGRPVHRRNGDRC